jgi:hypothetical protein
MSTKTIEPTTAQPIVEAAKARHYVTSLPKAWQRKPMPESEARKADLAWTDKSKHAIGAAESHKVVWAWMPLSPADHDLFVTLAKVYDPGDAWNSADPRSLAGRILLGWFEANRDSIVKDVQAYRSKDLTLEQAELNVERLQRQFEEARALMLGLKTQAEVEEA